MGRPEESDQANDMTGAESDSAVPCSICLDLVSYGGERSRAKLQCGHEFHLDCIGSAFNVKGMMQCPNCRKIEKGHWLYGSGPTSSSPELSMDEGTIDNYPIYFSVAEMPYRVHICPFRGLTHVHPPSESTVGVMSTLAPMVTHQHPVGSPHPHGWVQFQHTQYHHHHHQQPSGLPMPINSGAGTGGFDTPRSLPRFVPPGRVYDPHASLPFYAENASMNYLHAWGRDSLPYFP